MLAFQKALESGCDGIELDVQLTKDGEVVIIHDEYLDDLTDFTGNVRDYTLGELKSCNAGGNGRKPTASSRFRPLRNTANGHPAIR